MNYINLFRKLCYKDRSINYFRNLPDDEGELFNEIVAWLELYYKMRNEHHTASEKIRIALNRIRANYLGIVFEVEYNETASWYDDCRLNNILSSLYYKSVNDPTRFGDVKSKANVLLGVIPDEDEILKSLPNSLQTIIEEVHWQNYEEPEPFNSSFKPEIDVWDTSNCRNQEKPIHWKYWENILEPTKLFWNGCNYEDVDFIVSLFSQKEQRQQACEVLSIALQEYSKKYIGFVSDKLIEHLKKLRDDIDNDRIKPIEMPKSYNSKEEQIDSPLASYYNDDFDIKEFISNIESCQNNKQLKIIVSNSKSFLKMQFTKTDLSTPEYIEALRPHIKYKKGISLTNLQEQIRNACL